MHSADMIFFWARTNPEQPALIQPDLVLNYRELADAIRRISDRVANYGFKKEEPVAVSIHQPIQKLAVCYALAHHGLSIAPVASSALPHLRANDIHNVIFTGQGLVLSGGRNIRFEDTWLTRETPSHDQAQPPEKLTGRASTIFLTPDNMSRQRKSVMPNGALIGRLNLLPLIGEANYNNALIMPDLNSPSGFCRVAVNLYAGRTACFAGDPAAQLLSISTFNIDTLVCSPHQAENLVQFIMGNGPYRVDPIREVWIEGGQLTRDLGRRIQENLCRNVICGYGSAESGRIALANFDMIADIPEAVGFVVPQATVEIVDDNDEPLQQGKVGRVRCRTEFYSKISVESPPESNAPGDRWWYPGDLGRLGSDGMLYIAQSR